MGLLLLVILRIKLSSQLHSCVRFYISNRKHFVFGIMLASYPQKLAYLFRLQLLNESFFFCLFVKMLLQHLNWKYYISNTYLQIKNHKQKDKDSKTDHNREYNISYFVIERVLWPTGFDFLLMTHRGKTSSTNTLVRHRLKGTVNYPIWSWNIFFFSLRSNINTALCFNKVPSELYRLIHPTQLEYILLLIFFFFKDSYLQKEPNKDECPKGT